MVIYGYLHKNLSFFAFLCFEESLGVFLLKELNKCYLKEEVTVTLLQKHQFV